MIKNWLENIIKKQEKISSLELDKSIPYEDITLKHEDKANLFIKPDGTAILVDRFTGEIPRAWKSYDIDQNSILEYKKKYKIFEFEEKAPKPEINIKEEKVILN